MRPPARPSPVPRAARTFQCRPLPGGAWELPASAELHSGTLSGLWSRGQIGARKQPRFGDFGGHSETVFPISCFLPARRTRDGSLRDTGRSCGHLGGHSRSGTAKGRDKLGFPADDTPSGAPEALNSSHPGPNQAGTRPRVPPRGPGEERGRRPAPGPAGPCSPLTCGHGGPLPGASEQPSGPLSRHSHPTLLCPQRQRRPPGRSQAPQSRVRPLQLPCSPGSGHVTRETARSRN